MVGSAAALKRSGLLVSVILICVKTFVVPVVSKEFVTLLDAGSNGNETLSLANFGFLIGCFPTAPGTNYICNDELL